jgi:hypothetical protein
MTITTLTTKIMNKLKVGCSPITNTIYAGSVTNKGMWGANKCDVTESAPGAVAEYLIETDQFIVFDLKGKQYKLSCVEIK